MLRKIGICFCHGWGFDPSFWKPTASLFQDYPMREWNLGYRGGRKIELPDDSAEIWIAVGHSLGFRVLMESGVKWSGVIAVQGFHDFLGAESRMRKIRQRSLTQMMEEWKGDPLKVLNRFYEGCGIRGSDFPKGENDLNLNFDLLERDLISLSEVGRFDKNLKIPHRILGALDDRVVAPELLKSEWGEERIRWSKTGSHALGFFESDFVAESIHSLICELR